MKLKFNGCPFNPHYFADNFHDMIKKVQEIAVGVVVTAPGIADWNNPELRLYIEKYYKGADGVDTENWLKVLKLMKDITASDEEGLWLSGTLHGKGSLEAQRITTYREAELEPYVKFAKRVAGVLSGCRFGIRISKAVMMCKVFNIPSHGNTLSWVGTDMTQANAKGDL